MLTHTCMKQINALLSRADIQTDVRTDRHEAGFIRLTQLKSFFGQLHNHHQCADGVGSVTRTPANLA